MKRNLYLSFFLVLLLGGFQSVRAQIFTVTQNLIFTPATTTNCFSEVFNSQESSWTGANVTVNMTHDIFGNSTSPTFYNTVNNNGWRFIYFDIYKVNGGVETFETTITKYSGILQGGISTGSSSLSYNLNTLDLINANLSSGDKRVRVRFKMQLANLSLQVNGSVEANGVQQCSKAPLDGSFLNCNMGWVDCFTYYSCDADLHPNGFATLVPIYDRFGNIVGTTNSYTFNAWISGGSGNFTYNWIGPNGTSSNSSNFTFQTNGTYPSVYLSVVDNVSGCEYLYVSGRGRKGGEAEPGQELVLQVGPNPASSSDKITLNFNLPTADKYEMSIIDLTGKIVLDVPSEPDAYEGEHSIQISPVLAPGIYLVRLNTDSHGSKTAKLIVQ